MKDVLQRNICCLLLWGNLQRMERVRLPRVPFGKAGAARGKGRRKKGRTRPLRAVQHMKAWVKSQAVMLYGVEHDELWVHKGFCEVRAQGWE